MAPKYFQDYFFLGIKVTVASAEKRTQDRLGAFFGKFPQNRATPSPEVPISFDLYSAESLLPPLSIPESALLVSAPEFPVKIYMAGAKFFLTFGKSWLQLSLPEYHGAGVFDEKIWHHPGFAECLFFNGLCVLLNYHGLYRLHAAGLVFQKSGFLFAGKSGSGKSTLALTLVQRGWRYLSDDFLFLRRRDSEAEMLAIPVEFKIDDQTLQHFFKGSEKKHTFKIPNPDRISFYDKYYVGVERLYQNRFESRCRPRFLLFLEVASGANSNLTILGKNETLQCLLAASELFMFDAEKVAKHLAALNALVQQTSVYRLRVGREVLEDPETFEKFLLDNCQEK